jgi:hypothetical protein
MDYDHSFSVFLPFFSIIHLLFFYPVRHLTIEIYFHGSHI